MTTAHRPTFDPARGKEAQRGPAYHQRLLPAHTVLKHRQAGQGGVGGLGAPRDLRAELLKAEAAVKARANGGAIEAAQAATNDEDDHTTSPSSAKRKADADADDQDPDLKRRRLILEEAAAVDADSDSAASDADSDADSDSSDSDSEDEEAELLRELAKIKAERAAARAAEEAKAAAAAQEQREVDIALGNPLLNKAAAGGQDFGVKRRWDDDVVFRNQGRGTEERAKGRKEFVNDLLRSDFHKRFMGRYVR